MKKILMMFALLTGFLAAHAQQSSGDYFEGLSRKIGFSQMIPPHGLEITYDKTVHVKYADEPLLLNVEMCDFIHDGEAVNRPNNAMEIYLQELGNESPRLVRLVMKSVHGQDKRRVKHIGCKRFGVQYLLKGLYAHGDLLYFHTEVRNSTHVPFDVDFVTFKIVDKKIVKRTAMQEQVICPLRAFNYLTRVDGKKSGRTVFALPKFTIPDDKKLVVEMYEKQGGRHQSFEIENEDLVRAETINELKVR